MNLAPLQQFRPRYQLVRQNDKNIKESSYVALPTGLFERNVKQFAFIEYESCCLILRESYGLFFPFTPAL